jgi:hypothetical protein
VESWPGPNFQRIWKPTPRGRHSRAGAPPLGVPVPLRRAACERLRLPIESPSRRRRRRSVPPPPVQAAAPLRPPRLGRAARPAATSSAYPSCRSSTSPSMIWHRAAVLRRLRLPSEICNTRVASFSPPPRRCSSPPPVLVLRCVVDPYSCARSGKDQGGAAGIAQGMRAILLLFIH